MLGIGADPIPPPGPEAISGRASNESKAIAVTARFMDFLLCGGLWTRVVQRQVWRSQDSVRNGGPMRLHTLTSADAVRDPRRDPSRRNDRLGPRDTHP